MNRENTRTIPSLGGLAKVAPAGIEWLVLAFLLFCAWQARVPLAPIPFGDPDTWGYINPALSWLSGQGFQQTNGRDWLYPGLVTLFLKTTGSFAGVFYWQQALGYLAIILMAVTWRIWVSFFDFSPWVRLILTLAGAIPIWMQGVNPQLIFLESALRPESVMQFFGYAQLACLMAYCWCRWKQPHALLAVLAAAGALFFAYACLLLKPSWLFAFLATIAPIFVGIVGKGLPLRARLIGPALGVLLCGVFLWLPPELWFVKDKRSRTFLPSTLFTIHSRLIEKKLTADAAAMPAGDPEKARLETLLTELRSEMHVAETMQHNYEKLGFNPDYLFYRSHFMISLYNYAGGDPEKFRSYCIRLYLTTALTNPVGMANKVLTQMSHVLLPSGSTFYRADLVWKRIAKSTGSSFGMDVVDDYTPQVQEMCRVYLDQAAAMTQHLPKLHRSKVGRDWAKIATRLNIPTMILFIVAFGVVLVRPPLAPYRLAAWGAMILFSAPMGNALTVSLVHALDIQRYRISLGGFLLFALTAMAVFVLVVAAHYLRPVAWKYLQPLVRKYLPTRS